MLCNVSLPISLYGLIRFIARETAAFGSECRKAREVKGTQTTIAYLFQYFLVKTRMHYYTTVLYAELM